MHITYRFGYLVIHAENYRFRLTEKSINGININLTIENTFAFNNITIKLNIKINDIK